jgi:hypothetical protein
MATRLEEVYRHFLNSIEDVEWLVIEDDEVIEDLLLSYLEKATVDFYKCRKDLNINYIDKSFYEKLTLREIVILSMAMKLHYLDPKIIREENLKQAVTSKDFSKLSNANMLDKLTKLKESTKKELKGYMTEYDYSGFKGFV